MDEASKSWRLFTAEEQSLLCGKGLDVGCGRDPIRPDAQRFDVEHGDANRITEFVIDVGTYDYVFSSHCLEHMHDPVKALHEWWKLVRVGGTLMVVVPDEDLYELGYWPSIANHDHKATFTISKQMSWSPVSCNLLELSKNLEGAILVSLRLQDQGYDRTLLQPRAWPRCIAVRIARCRLAVIARLPWTTAVINRLMAWCRFPVDQTAGRAVAQILMIVHRKEMAPFRGCD